MLFVTSKCHFIPRATESRTYQLLIYATCPNTETCTPWVGDTVDIDQTACLVETCHMHALNCTAAQEPRQIEPGLPKVLNLSCLWSPIRISSAHWNHLNAVRYLVPWADNFDNKLLPSTKLNVVYDSHPFVLLVFLKTNISRQLPTPKNLNQYSTKEYFCQFLKDSFNVS